jgi:hypothetical protein
MKKSLILFFIVFGVFACSKERKYSGDYSCEVDGHFYELNAYNIDTTYQEHLEVKREKKSIIVLNKTIPGDSLIEGEWYNHPVGYGYFRVKVSADSLYVSTWFGGWGGGSSYKYSCEQE